jgi:hypothetical protein
MINKLYKVQLKDGKIPATLYQSIGDAMKAHGASNIAKIDEVPAKKGKTTDVAKSKDLVLVLSSRGDDDLELSNKCGYAVTYNCPSYKKIYQGMKYLEVSENYVLEGEILKLDKFDLKVHLDWAAIIPRHTEKLWKWSIYHTKSVLIPRTEAEAKYGKIPGVQGGIGYIHFNLPKEKLATGNPLPDEKVCFNCTNMLWMVGIGQGLKCSLTMGNIENRRHTCEKFEFKNDKLKNE